MKLFKRLHKDGSGQVLTTVIIFVAFGLSVIALSAALTIINLQNTAKTIEGTRALNYAEAGAEEAIIRLIRDPNYAGAVPETFSPDPGAVVTVTVTGNTTDKTVVSAANYNGFIRKVQVMLNFNEGKVNLVSWKQVI